MDAREHIYYALGEVAYAAAKIDGVVQGQERNKIHEIVEAETAHHDVDFDIAEIIFHVLNKDNADPNESYASALKEFEAHKRFITADMAIDFIAFVEKIAIAFNSYDPDERAFVGRFRRDLMKIVGI